MAHIVTEPCIGCKNTVCVTVCPVDCFHEDVDALWIDPEECIDCGACVPECPVNAIFDMKLLPPQHAKYVAINAEKAKKLPVITQRKEPLK